MRLEPASTPSKDNPTEIDIAAAVRDEDNEFVILHHDDGESFMQAGGGCVEYRVGPTKQHHRARGDVAVAQVIKLLTLYNRGDESYRTAVQWDDVTEEMARCSRRSAIITVALIVVVLAVVLYFTVLRG